MYVLNVMLINYLRYTTGSQHVKGLTTFFEDSFSAAQHKMLCQIILTELDRKIFFITDLLSFCITKAICDLNVSPPIKFNITAYDLQNEIMFG